MEDDNIIYKSLTSEYLEEALANIKDSFFIHENVCSTLEVSKEPGASDELLLLCRNAAKCGVSLVATDKITNKVAGVSFNQIQIKSSGNEESTFEKFAKSCKTSGAKAVVDYMIDVDSRCDLFELCNVDCLLEIMFLSTVPEYRGRKIGKNLTKCTIALSKKLLAGENVKVNLEGKDKLPLEPIPKVLSAIFTTFITQKIGDSCGFKVALFISYEEFMHKGKSFAHYIGPETPGCTLAYRKVED